MRGIHRIIFYGAPPPLLMVLFSVWPADILVIALASDIAAGGGIPEPLHMWCRIEEGNAATSAVLDDDLQDDVMLPVYTPPIDHDLISPSSPSPQVVSSTQFHDVVEIISDNEGDDDDDDDCVFVN